MVCVKVHKQNAEVNICRRANMVIATVHSFRTISFICIIFRDLAKLVSRYIWDVEIVGSSPATPTKYIFGAVEYRLVRQIFILKSRVRLPAALQKILFFDIFSYKCGVSSMIRTETIQFQMRV